MRTNGENIQLWVVSIPAHKTRPWRSVLSLAEHQRAARFRLPADQNRFAITRGILKTLLGGYLQVAPHAIEFTANQYGKPAIAGAPLQFNVSHSGDYALLAFAHSTDVGVDIERVGAERVVSELTQRVLSPAEMQRFHTLAEAARTRTFFQIWTLKEALLKALGTGFSVEPGSIEVAFYPAEPKLLHAPAADPREWTLQSLPIGGDEYAAALAVRDPAPGVVEIKHFE